MTLTATADAEAPLVPPAEAPAFAAQERPVFAATTAARPRALRLAGRVTAGLVALWLVALVLGTFGFGPVAGIGLPRIGGGNTDGQPQRDAIHKTRAQQPNERITSSGVTLTTRHGGHAGASASGRGNTRTDGPRRAATHQAPASRPGGSSAGPRHSTTPSGGGSNATAQTPAASSTPAGTATPTSSSTSSGTTTTTTNPHANTTHSQATPPGSSSTAPGSRSNAGTAPGRDQSTASPTPGSGRSEHAPPKG